MTLLADPPARKQLVMGRAFLPLFHNRDKFVLVESPRGCLKTCTILHKLMSRAAQFPGLHWYLWRSNRSLLSTTVLPSFEKYVIPFWHNVRGMRLLNPAARPTQRSEYIFENGSVFIPCGLDEILRGTSSEAAGGYLAEAIELHNSDQATVLSGMMREPGVDYHQIIVDVNPGAPDHWTNHITEQVDNSIRRVRCREDYEILQQHNTTPAVHPIEQWKRIIAKIIDNPFYFDADLWKSKPAGDSFLEGLGVLSPHMKARWIDGEWKAAEGGVFPEFEEEKHVVSDFAIPKDWPVVLACDPGYAHVLAIAIVAVAPNGRLYLIGERVVAQQTIPQHAAWMTQYEKDHAFIIRQKFGDPHDMFKHTLDGNGVSKAEQFAKLGQRFTPAPSAQNNAQVSDQVELIRTKLVTNLSDGAPSMQVFRSCKYMISSFQSWMYKKNTRGELAPDEQYEEAYKDEMDAVRMIVASGPTFAPQMIRKFGAQPDDSE